MLNLGAGTEHQRRGRKNPFCKTMIADFSQLRPVFVENRSVNVEFER